MIGASYYTIVYRAFILIASMIGLYADLESMFYCFDSSQNCKPYMQIDYWIYLTIDMILNIILFMIFLLVETSIRKYKLKGQKGFLILLFALYLACFLWETVNLGFVIHYNKNNYWIEILLYGLFFLIPFFIQFKIAYDLVIAEKSKRSK